MNTLFLLYTVLAHRSSPSDGPRWRHSLSVALPYSSPFSAAKFTSSMIFPHQPDAQRIVSTPGSFCTSEALANRNLSLQSPRSPRERHEKQRFKAPCVRSRRLSLTSRTKIHDLRFMVQSFGGEIQGISFFGWSFVVSTHLWNCQSECKICESKFVKLLKLKMTVYRSFYTPIKDIYTIIEQLDKFGLQNCCPVPLSKAFTVQSAFAMFGNRLSHCLYIRIDRCFGLTSAGSIWPKIGSYLYQDSLVGSCRITSYLMIVSSGEELQQDLILRISSASGGYLV